MVTTYNVRNLIKLHNLELIFYIIIIIIIIIIIMLRKIRFVGDVARMVEWDMLQIWKLNVDRDKLERDRNLWSDIKLI